VTEARSEPHELTASYVSELVASIDYEGPGGPAFGVAIHLRALVPR
jgi:hypothetical protein